MSKKKIAVISDTHGLLRPEITALFQNSDHIIHAGDIGDYSIIGELNKIAPTTAVRGNIDWKDHVLPYSNILKFNAFSIFVIHQLSQLDVRSINENIDAIIYGHSHKPKIENQNGILFFNPGSAGPKRFNLPITVGFLNIENNKLTAEVVQIN